MAFFRMPSIKSIHKRILALGAILGFIIIFWFLTLKTIEHAPAQFSHNVSGPVKEKSAIAYTVIIYKSEQLPQLSELIQSLQKYIIQNEKEAPIYIFFSKNLDSPTKKIIRSWRFVVWLELEKIIPDKDLINEEKRRNLNANWFAPWALEYLLLEYSKVAVIDISKNQFISPSSFDKLFEKAESTGRVLVPLTNRHGRFDQVEGEQTFQFILYTRRAFVEYLKPILDCKRGLQCPGLPVSASKNLAQSVVRRSAVAFHKANSKLHHTTDEPFKVDKFEWISKGEPKNAKDSSLLKIGIGVDFDVSESLESFMEDKIGRLVESLKAQNPVSCSVIIYILNHSTIANQKVKEILIPRAELDEFISFRISKGSSDESISTAAMSAFMDGCDHFYNFGQHFIIPSPRTKWLQSIIRYGKPTSPKAIILTLINGDDNIWMLKELVGSIHGSLAVKKMSPPPLVIICGMKLSAGIVNMIKLWEFVEYHDVDEVLFGINGLGIGGSLDMDNMRIPLMEAFINKYDSILFVGAGIIFTRTDGIYFAVEKIHREGIITVDFNIDQIGTLRAIEGFDKGTFNRVYEMQLSCLKGTSNCESLPKPPKIEGNANEKDLGIKSVLPKPSNHAQRSQQYCHIELKPEIMYYANTLGSNTHLTDWSKLSNPETIKTTEKIKIAFLIPSKNSDDSTVENAPLISTFLMSLITTVKENEWDKFLFSIYIGYDRDDPIIDRKRDDLDRVINEMFQGRRKILVKYHLLPTAKCVTLLWNMLFIDAIYDGNDYFYQINDDVKLLNAGWATDFVTTLRQNDDLGVTGPNDVRWGCRLLTQSFVGRKHFEIFHWYFPIQIKDWYSDNWITEVYGGKTFCRSDFQIRNGAVGTRYNVCDQPRWREAVSKGQETIKTYLSNLQQKNFEQYLSKHPE